MSFAFNLLMEISKKFKNIRTSEQKLQQNVIEIILTKYKERYLIKPKHLKKDDFYITPNSYLIRNNFVSDSY
ncbi:MAG: hypothetical protein J6R17_07115 [Bacteroidales bacterium]|nr:hypothetical protein [Bacteroidales bacterium]